MKMKSLTKYLVKVEPADGATVESKENYSQNAEGFSDTLGLIFFFFFYQKNQKNGKSFEIN